MGVGAEMLRGLRLLHGSGLSAAEVRRRDERALQLVEAGR